MTQKNIIITGISRGIGLELIRQFSKDGHQVIGLSRHCTDELKELPHFDYICTDLSIEDNVNRLQSEIKEKYGHIDIIIHNAGALVNQPFETITAAQFKYVYDVNVFGVALLNQAILPLMPKGAHVVTISSMGGIQGSMKFPGLAAYSSSKAAVITLSELLAEEYKDRGISFNVLALGAVQTEMLAEAFPGYLANIQPDEMASYIKDFGLTGNRFFNGKVLQVSSTTP